MNAKGPVVVLGAGSAGEHFVGALRRLDPEVEIVIVERHLAGGECSYYACLPTKTLLRPVEILAAAGLAPGAAEAMTGQVDVERVFWWRSQVADGRDDSWHADWLANQRAELVRGDARIARPGVVAVDGRELEYGTLVVATGSSPAIPPIDGIEEVEAWTSRDAVWAGEIPESLVVLGGGPVGTELAQFFRRMGSRVTIVESHDRLLTRLDPEAGSLLRERFEEDDGIELRVGVDVTGVERTSSSTAIHLSTGEMLESARLLLATGRRPSVHGIGLEQLGLEITHRGIEVDDRLRAAEGVWAIGDAAGVGLLTHLGKYQARVAAANIAGRDVVADYRAVPSAVFTDPQVASVGRLDGDVVTARHEIRSGRLSTYERPRRPGLVKLAADPTRGVLVGALAIGPEAGEWLGQLTLAVRAQVAIDVLLDTIQPYPTFSEAIFNALLELDSALRQAAS